MTTIDLVDAGMKKNVSEFQALAITVMNAPESINVNLKSAYEASLQQPTVVLTDIDTPKLEIETEEAMKVITNLTGEDVSVARWAAKVVPSTEDALADVECACEREELLKIVRQASYELIQREMVNCSAYLTESAEFNCKIELSVPSQFSKMAYDTLLHYYSTDDEKNSKLYAKSPKTGMPAIRIVCYPDWVNEEWLYWKSQNSKNEAGEPPRIMMIYDIETNTGFLLGAKSFSEIRKAIKMFAWNTAIASADALPVNGAAKTISILKGNKKSETTFLTVSDDCSDRSFFGTNIHASDLKTKNETALVSGNSGLIMLTKIQGRKKALVNFGENYFGSIESAVARNKKNLEVVSAEDIVVAKNENDEKIVIMNPQLSPNGKVHNLFEQAEKDLSLPEYLVFVVKDELLPPVTLVKDNDLISALWFTYATECECCSGTNIIPGGNPNAVWTLSKELDVFDKALKKSKFKLIVLNSLYFLNHLGEPAGIDDTILLSVYTKVAKSEIRWKEWKMLPGFFVPEKSTFKDVKKDFDSVFDLQKTANADFYKDMMRESIFMKIDYLREVCAPSSFIAALHKMSSKLL
ncbi:MAG: hypothetical protein ACOX2F_07675 [bacterium]